MKKEKIEIILQEKERSDEGVWKTERVKRMLFRNAKRRYAVGGVVLLSLLFSGCGGNTEDMQTNSQIETAIEETDKMDETVRQLFQKNIDCMMNIFCINHLPYDEESVQEGHLCKVSEERFAGYADFEEYIRSVYCAEEAERLLQDFPYEGEPLYRDVEGVLYIDLNLIGAKGYFVDWTDCKITVDDLTAESCAFTATGMMEEPAEELVQEAYTVNGTVVQENGKWVLEKMMY